MLAAFGVVLILGGLAHSAGVAYLYASEGVPAIERMLVAVWVAEAQLTAGAFYVTASRRMRAGAAWKGWAVAGAVTVLTWAAPFIPVLFLRAPVLFRVPAIVYAVLSAVILFRAARDTG
jgi:hypothetical protein